MRIAANVSLFLLTAIAVSAGIGRFDAVPESYTLKLEALASDPAHFDLFYLGSSRLYRGVIPQRVDARVAERGHALESFNLALLAMRPHEANYQLRRLLRAPPSGLRYVVIELDDWTPIIRPANRFTPRTLYWHDRRESLSVLRSAWLLDAPVTARLDYALTHVLHFGARAARLGRLVDLYRDRIGADDADDREAEVSRLAVARGFVPFTAADYENPPSSDALSSPPLPTPPSRGRKSLEDDPTAARQSSRREFLDGLPTYEARLAALSAANAGPGDLSHYNTEATVQQVRMVRASGLVPIYLIPPDVRPTPHLRRLYRDGVVPHLIALDDPIAYPELYLPENRFDLRHVNTQGAEAFSDLLGDRIADILDSVDPNDAREQLESP